MALALQRHDTIILTLDRTNFIKSKNVFVLEGTTEPSTSVETTSMESTSEGTFTFHILTAYSLLNLKFIIA